MTRRRRLLVVALALAVTAVVASWPAPETPVLTAATPLPPTAVPVGAAAPIPAMSPPPADLTGYKLAGVFGRAAVIEDGSGRQRLARIGAPVAPGVRLAGVGRTSATLESGGQAYRLELRGAAPPVAVQRPLAASPPTAGAREAALYRLAFKPEREGDRTIGFRLRDGPVPPALARVGLQPGDVVTRINGEAFRSIEKVMELDAEIAGADMLSINFIRDGRAMRGEASVSPK